MSLECFNCFCFLQGMRGKSVCVSLPLGAILGESCSDCFAA